MSITSGTLVITERTADGLSRHSLEVIALAQTMDGPLHLLFPGTPSGDIATKLQGISAQEILTCPELEHLDGYDGDTHVDLYARYVESLNPKHVLLPYSYTARDYAPRLAARLGVTLVSDCIAVEQHQEDYSYIRQMFQGKVQARVRIEGDGPVLVAFQAGVGCAEDVRHSESATPVSQCEIDASTPTMRIRTSPPIRESVRTVDLTRAPTVVAVGRGIKGEEHIALARRLADLLNAELAATRAVCDEGWLPIERQVGSSGQTVAPSLYIALGISGAIQHLVGMKSSGTIVAINKDSSAPIFDIADYGIVGDLFEVVPALIKALEKT